MKVRTILLGASVLALGAATIGGTAVQALVADKGGVEAQAVAAAAEAAKAQRALVKHRIGPAIQAAEAAVALDPRNAQFRALLGQTYLSAGRFTSASQALADALALDPGNGRAALNLALAQVGTGDWAGARATLDRHADQIPASDLGLAVALAGDSAAGLQILGAAARQPDASAKTRQNLALVFALAGHWQEARAVAAVDLPPDQVDARMLQWASFSQPSNAYDQVAALLGVEAVKDGGQPVALALNTAPVAVAVAEAPAAPQSHLEVSAAEPEAAPAVTMASIGRVVFAPRREIVQALPAASARTAVARVRTVAAAPSPAKGDFYVQLGAFASAEVARDAWARLSRRAPALARHAPQGAFAKTKAGSFYRLSVGGFARSDAVALCGTVKARGGACFVRLAAGDQVASWSRKGVQVAAR